VIGFVCGVKRLIVTLIIKQPDLQNP